MLTCLHFSSPTPPKSHQTSILKGIDLLVDFDIDFQTAQDDPKTPHPRRRSKRQDGPKRPPKTAPRASKKTIPLRFFRVWPPRASETRPRAPQERFLVDVWPRGPMGYPPWPSIFEVCGPILVQLLVRSLR